MQIMNTFVSKIGPSGKRNRQARRKQARIQAYHAALGHKPGRSERVIKFLNKASEDGRMLVAKEHTKVIPEVKNAPTLESAKYDLTGVWDESVARTALALFASSGKSQRSFAAEFGFPESRLRSWKKKLETVSV